MHLTGRTRSAGLWLAVGATTLLSLAAAQVASASNSRYPLGQAARTFHTSDGGWNASTSFGGLCVAGVTCPTVTNGFAAGGGVAGQGDGYLRTRIGSLLGVGATSRSVYRSPSFKYRGVAGRTPNSVSFRLSRRSSLGALLGVAGNSAQYSVDLVDASKHGAATSIVDAGPIGDQDSWRSRRVSVNPSSLKIGDRYRVRIKSEFVTGAQIVPGGRVGYDSVVLSAKGPGHARPHGVGIHRLGVAVRRGIGPAVRTGHGLKVTAKCPRSAKPHKCEMKLSAMLKRSGPSITNKRSTRLGAGKHRRVRLHVRHTYSKRLDNRKRVLVRARVKVGQRKVTVIKSVRIVRH
jgi:hypothetical protein